jgi:UDP-N-acetyl-D-mannosaminuronic acid dehydrogenase
VLCPILSRGGLKAPDDILVAYCPERILPGRVLQELVSNARVIGGLDRRSAERARELYGRFVDGEIHLTDDKTAELVKLFENTYRDVNIALANEFAKMAEAAGCDGHAAIRFANAHPRVDILAPGPGVGGHCIPVDPWFLAERFPGVARLVVAAREVNDGMVEHLAARLSGLGVARGAKVAILGAAYKADIDDARESPSERLAERLAAAGMKVAVHDPLVKRFHLPLSPLEEALAGAEAAVLAVNHAEYRALEPGFLARTMRRPLVLDARRAIDRERFEAAGVRVVTLGVGG